MPEDCCSSNISPNDALLTIGYESKELESIPQSSILDVGCGVPLSYANLKEGETVLDLGSGAGIDVFLASKQVKNTGRVISIDFTDYMLQKATKVRMIMVIITLNLRKVTLKKRFPLKTALLM